MLIKYIRIFLILSSSIVVNDKVNADVLLQNWTQQSNSINANSPFVGNPFSLNFSTPTGYSASVSSISFMLATFHSNAGGYTSPQSGTLGFRFDLDGHNLNLLSTTSVTLPVWQYPSSDISQFTSATFSLSGLGNMSAGSHSLTWHVDTSATSSNLDYGTYGFNNSTTATSNYGLTFSSSSFQNSSSSLMFQMNGTVTAVPEPATIVPWMVLILSMPIVWFHRRLRASRITFG